MFCGRRLQPCRSRTDSPSTRGTKRSGAFTELSPLFDGGTIDGSLGVKPTHASGYAPAAGRGSIEADRSPTLQRAKRNGQKSIFPRARKSNRSRPLRGCGVTEHSLRDVESAACAWNLRAGAQSAPTAVGLRAHLTCMPAAISISCKRMRQEFPLNARTRPAASLSSPTRCRQATTVGPTTHAARRRGRAAGDRTPEPEALDVLDIGDRQMRVHSHSAPQSESSKRFTAAPLYAALLAAAVLSACSGSSAWRSSSAMTSDRAGGQDCRSGSPVLACSGSAAKTGRAGPRGAQPAAAVCGRRGRYSRVEYNTAADRL